MTITRLKTAPRLRVVPTTEDALATLLRDRDRALREIAELDAMMLAYRRRYAAERGEFMLPSLERLRRELLA
jgi:hypothetical protein